MIVNIGHRRTKINYTYAYTKNSLELLALLRTKNDDDALGVFVFNAEVCTKKRL
jgi:hypothetical protein